MPSYQDFLKLARERQEKKKSSTGGVLFTNHAEYKMKQYSLSAQRIKTVMRNPKRREEGIAKDTIAVMQPVSIKHKDGKETWSQEIWVMYVQVKSRKPKGYTVESQKMANGGCGVRVISAWRYPGVSPQGNPIPEKILRELENESIMNEIMII